VLLTSSAWNSNRTALSRLPGDCRGRGAGRAYRRRARAPRAAAEASQRPRGNARSCEEIASRAARESLWPCHERMRIAQTMLTTRPGWSIAGEVGKSIIKPQPDRGRQAAGPGPIEGTPLGLLYLKPAKPQNTKRARLSHARGNASRRI
jgi:hypothetical protein